MAAIFSRHDHLVNSRYTQYEKEYNSKDDSTFLYAQQLIGSFHHVLYFKSAALACHIEFVLHRRYLTIFRWNIPTDSLSMLQLQVQLHTPNVSPFSPSGTLHPLRTWFADPTRQVFCCSNVISETKTMIRLFSSVLSHCALCC